MALAVLIVGFALLAVGMFLLKPYSETVLDSWFAPERNEIEDLIDAANSLPNGGAIVAPLLARTSNRAAREKLTGLGFFVVALAAAIVVYSAVLTSI